MNLSRTDYEAQECGIRVPPKKPSLAVNIEEANRIVQDLAGGLEALLENLKGPQPVPGEGNTIKPAGLVHYTSDLVADLKHARNLLEELSQEII